MLLDVKMAIKAIRWFSYVEIKSLLLYTQKVCVLLYLIWIVYYIIYKIFALVKCQKLLQKMKINTTCTL